MYEPHICRRHLQLHLYIQNITLEMHHAQKQQTKVYSKAAGTWYGEKTNLHDLTGLSAAAQDCSQSAPQVCSILRRSLA